MFSNQDAANLQSMALEFAKRAVEFDQLNQIEPAIYYYCEAAHCLNTLYQINTNLTNMKSKAIEYVERGEQLKKQKESVDIIVVDHQKIELERAEFLLNQALTEDEAGNSDEAIELYTQAVELCLQYRKEIKDSAYKSKLGELAQKALERAESLKGKPAASKDISPSESSNQSLAHSSTEQQSSVTAKPAIVTGKGTYTPAEIQVLRQTSVINGREYVPFMSLDLKERFAYPLPFSDKDGLLTLSPKQRAVFHGWVRPEEISSNPTLFETINCFTIKQTIVSDCSFIASLAVSAHYEKRFGKKILTNKIYPQNKSGQPVYNPCGKYMIKLHINGIPRKVVIDDRLPLGIHRELLCSYSNNKNEFWVSMFEKAYLKVMGGYNFPGSNSNIDLHALTGWIPENISMVETDFNKDQVFKMLLERHHKGDVLVSISTGQMGEEEASRAGLVPTHAYALLDVKEVQGKRLLLMKNPWSECRWKGKYSEQDTINWTPSLREALKYDPRNAQMFDNGIFWIDFDSLVNFFRMIYINWNPELFKYTSSIHQTWQAGQGPIKDLYSMADNPQFRLEIKNPGSAIWLLLTRHITDRDDFAENQEFITLLVYKNGGKKVYLPNSPEPFIDGVRINSPHYLCKLIVPKNGERFYTLVVSQYQKMNTIHFTLRGYSTCPFSLTPIVSSYKFRQEIKDGKWTERTAGGCGNHPKTYNTNPIYQVAINSQPNVDLLIELKGPKQYSIGFEIVAVNVNPVANSFDRRSSGSFRSGYNVLELENIPPGAYNVIPSTFYPNQIGPFILTLKCSAPIKMVQLQ